MHLNSVAIIVLVINWIAEGDFKSKWNRIRFNTWILIPVLFYLLHIIGLLYTSNMEDGNFDLEKKMAIFILPLIIGSSSILLTKTIFNELVLTFIVSCFFTSILCVGKIVYNSLFYHHLNYLFNYDLIEPIAFHPVYFSIYIVLSICFLLSWFFDGSKDKKNNLIKLVVGVLTIYFIFFLLLLASRTVVSIFFLILFAYFIYLIKKKYVSLKIGFSIIIALIAVVTILAIRSPAFRDRFSTVLNSDIKGFGFNKDTHGYLNENSNGLTLRLMKWKCSVSLIRDNFFLGVGTGDTEDALQRCYVEIGLWDGIARFNAHNQFLQTWLGIGVPGFLLLLLYFFYPLYLGIKHGDFACVAFVLIFIASCLTESMLCCQKGIIFYSFFSTLFIIKYFYQKDNK